MINADRRSPHRLAEDGTARLSFEQAKPFSSALARLTALGRE